MLKFKQRGGTEMVRTIQRTAKNAKPEMGRAEYAEASIEMTEMKQRTPVWNPKRKLPPGHVPGSLRASGTVHEPETRGDKVSVDLSFGNAEVDYAVVVHEDLEAEHATGQAKYMESVLNESAPYMGRRLAARISLERMVKG